MTSPSGETYPLLTSLEVVVQSNEYKIESFTAITCNLQVVTVVLRYSFCFLFVDTVKREKVYFDVMTIVKDLTTILSYVKRYS